MDEKTLELAGDLADSMVAAGVSKSRSKPKRPDAFDGFCLCGAEIPQVRIDHELYNCVHCQTALERRSKLFGVR